MKGYNKNRQKFNVQLSDGTNNISFEKMWALNQASKSPRFVSNPLAKAYTPSFGLGGILSAFAPLAGAAGTMLGGPLAGAAASSLLSIGGNALEKKDKPTVQVPTTGMNSNPYGMQGYASGGAMEQISPNSVEVTGAPGQTDGNQINYKGQPVNVDHGEVIDHSQDIVFSDKLFDPRSGKSFADTVKPMEKLIGKLSKTPSNINNNTIKALEQQKQKVFQTQEQVATALGQRNSDGSTVQGGQPAMASGGRMNYASGGDPGKRYYNLFDKLFGTNTANQIPKTNGPTSAANSPMRKLLNKPKGMYAPETTITAKRIPQLSYRDALVKAEMDAAEGKNYTPFSDNWKAADVHGNAYYYNLPMPSDESTNVFTNEEILYDAREDPKNPSAVHQSIQNRNSNYTPPPTQSSKNNVATTGNKNVSIPVRNNNTQTPSKSRASSKSGNKNYSNPTKGTASTPASSTPLNEFKYAEGYKEYANLDLRPNEFNQYVDAFLASEEGQKYQRIQKGLDPKWSFNDKDGNRKNIIGPKYAALLNNPEFQKFYKTPQTASSAATGKGSPYTDPTSVFQNAPGFAPTLSSTNKYSRPDYADAAKNTFDTDRENARLAGTTADDSEENKRPGSEPFDAAGNINKFFKEHPNPAQPPKKPSKYGIGDYLQLGAAGASVLGALFDRPERQKPNLDKTQITQNRYDPANALMQNQYTTNAGMMANANNYSSAGVQAGLQNLMANKYRADSQVVSQYDQMNQQARTQYEQRLQQQNQFNAQTLSANDDKNVANRAAYTNNLYGALQTVSNVGKGFNQRATSEKAIKALIANDPQAAQGFLDPATGQVDQTAIQNNNELRRQVYQTIEGDLLYQDGTKYKKPGANWSGGKIKLRRRK